MPEITHLPAARLKSNAVHRTNKIIRLLAECKPITQEQRQRLHVAVETVLSQDGER